MSIQFSRTGQIPEPSEPLSTACRSAGAACCQTRHGFGPVLGDAAAFSASRTAVRQHIRAVDHVHSQSTPLRPSWEV